MDDGQVGNNMNPAGVTFGWATTSARSPKSLKLWISTVYLCFILLVAAAEDTLPNEDSQALDRVILVYPVDGCRGSTSESAGSPLSGLELQSPRRARDIALSELERRVNDMRTQRFGESGLRILGEDDTGSSVKLESRYLNALQMEITHVPDFMTNTEMLEMSGTLPCVEMVSPDYIKRIQDRELPDQTHEPVRELADSVSTEASKRKASRTRTSDQTDSQSRNLQGNPVRRPVPAQTVEGTLLTPNDNLFREQWHLQESQTFGIGSQSTWSQWRGSPGLTIAIIDSGCDLNHPDLKSKKWVNPGEICGDGIDNDRNGYVDDCYGWDWVDNDNNPSPQGSGHGTAAAGIIAAATNNAIGVAGICWECRVMCLRFIEGVEGRVSNQVAAIDYAAKMGAKISNNSYGGYGFSRLEFEVIKRAKSYGHLFVASAGNNNYNTDLPQYDHTPSIYNLNNILAVGASTLDGTKASFSNYGATSVDIFAPGSRIVTIENGGGYAVVSGTSFAAPMGAGAAALVWSRFPSLSHTEVIQSLVSSCKSSKTLTGLAVCGGIIDVENAMKYAMQSVKNKDRKSPPPPRAAAVAQAAPDEDESAESLTPTAATPGYSGWLGAFLSGFSRAFSRPHTSQTDEQLTIEAPVLKDSVHEPYLVFRGTGSDGEAVTVDPMYLNKNEFDFVISPYESALGLQPEKNLEKTSERVATTPLIKATNSLERLVTSITAPTINQLQFMTSAFKNIVWDRMK